MSKLYLVPTPIGNLEDITLRALKVLKEVAVILAEDTRHTGKLLKHYEIKNKMLAYHQFNEHKKVEEIVGQLSAGVTMAMVSDAGTPAISDAGYLLVRSCIQAGVEIECLPGATAVIPAVVLSGLPAERFCYEGFLPHKKGRQTRLNMLIDETRTMVFYESPHRLIKTLQQFVTVFGADRQASVSRELTKVFEETQRGTLPDLIHYYQNNTLKGEIVIVVAGKKP